jgi:hypothetical protein
MLKEFTSDDYYTPKYVFDAINVEFDIDVCAPQGGVEWIPAKNHFSLLDDGLSQEWQGVVWMNPPYSKPTPWVEKFIQHGNGITLLPFMKSNWFISIWEQADIILPLNARTKFVRPDNKNGSVYPPVFLAALGDVSVNALKNSKLGKIR